MKKILYSMGVFVTSAFLLSSCKIEDPGTSIKYDGQSFVEFDILTSGNVLPPDGIDIVEDGVPTVKSFKINLVGKVPQQEVKIKVSVLGASTAVAGTHYNLPSTEVTIPAGQTSGNLVVEILDDNLTVGRFDTLWLVLEGGDGYVPAEKFKNLPYVFGVCPFNINTFTGNYNCDEPGYKVYPVKFTRVSGTTVKNDNFWDVGAQINYVFAADGSSVTIPTQPFVYGPYNLVVDGASPSKPSTCSGSFKVDYEVRFQAGGVVENNTHTFTKR
ncbi:hypothetical protein FHS56_002069 [Thermonema lapsum]|uniref:DUF4843 domain-containing protein n=1 Tax=Thermonema lapsum TaxID=28195 RepID=A0A846MSF9_9BACT|nr:DUF4843 domain-containing protein [Thermonema lapsum]NIK74544.1 hypothetical protein [Thermonema lapsum]